MADRFTSNSAGWRRVLRGRGAQSATSAQAARVAAAARAAAPVDTGEYRDSITVVDDPTPNRARSKVVAPVRHAALVEARSNTLGRALEE